MELLGIDFDISGYSTALYSTYWMVEPLGLLFDCGDGAASFFQQRGRAARFIACSHPDRDHLSGLPQFLQLNSQPGSPVVLYPNGSGSFAALQSFIAKFDAHASGSVWRGVADGERIEVRKDWFLETRANRHFPRIPGEAAKSLSYLLLEQRKKLRPGLHHLSGPELGQLRAEKGEEAVTEIITETILAYSADTPVEPPEFWRDPKVLIHEATFLDREEAARHDGPPRHSVLGEVLQMASRMKSLRALVLGHFSTRYSNKAIREAIIEGAAQSALAFPVYALFPGEARHHILSGDPVWKGTAG